jgi:hypothetical protein
MLSARGDMRMHIRHMAMHELKRNGYDVSFVQQVGDEVCFVRPK